MAFPSASTVDAIGALHLIPQPPLDLSSNTVPSELGDSLPQEQPSLCQRGGGGQWVSKPKPPLTQDGSEVCFTQFLRGSLVGWSPGCPCQ